MKSRFGFGLALGLMCMCAYSCQREAQAQYSGPPTQAQQAAIDSYTDATNSKNAAAAIMTVTTDMATHVYDNGPRGGATPQEEITRIADYDQLVNRFDGGGLCQIADNLVASANQDMVNAQGFYTYGAFMSYMGWGGGDPYFVQAKAFTDAAKGKYDTLVSIKAFILPIYSELVALSAGS